RWGGDGDRPRAGRGHGRGGVVSAGPGLESAGGLVKRRPEQLGPPGRGGAGVPGPSRSSPRRVTVTMRWLIPSTLRRSSANRSGPSPSRPMTSSDHLSPTRSSTSRARQSAGPRGTVTVPPGNQGRLKCRLLAAPMVADHVAGYKREPEHLSEPADQGAPPCPNPPPSSRPPPPAPKAPTPPKTGEDHL